MFCLENVSAIPDFVSLSPGTRYSLALKTSRIHRLPHPHVSNCSNQYPNELNDIVPQGATYSNQNCMMLCFGMFSSSTHCNCTSPSFIEGQREKLSYVNSFCYGTQNVVEAFCRNDHWRRNGRHAAPFLQKQRRNKMCQRVHGR